MKTSTFELGPRSISYTIYVFISIVFRVPEHAPYADWCEIYEQSPFTDWKDLETSRWYPNRLCEGECHHCINLLKEKCPGVEIARTHPARFNIACEYSRLSSLLVASIRPLRRGARISGLLRRLDFAKLRNL